MLEIDTICAICGQARKVYRYRRSNDDGLPLGAIVTEICCPRCEPGKHERLSFQALLSPVQEWTRYEAAEEAETAEERERNPIGVWLIGGLISAMSLLAMAIVFAACRGGK